MDRYHHHPPNKGSEPKGKTIYAVAPTQHEYWGISSFGRAAALQAVGDQFDPDILHQVCGSRGRYHTVHRNMGSLQFITSYIRAVWEDRVKSFVASKSQNQ